MLCNLKTVEIFFRIFVFSERFEIIIIFILIICRRNKSCYFKQEIKISKYYYGTGAILASNVLSWPYVEREVNMENFVQGVSISHQYTVLIFFLIN